VKVFSAFQSKSFIVFSHKFDSSSLYLSYRIIICESTFFVVKELITKDFKFCIECLEIAASSELAGSCVSVLMGTSKELEGPRFLEGACKCCGTE